MGSEWDIPKWQKEGRTGPGSPRYAKASDRAKVRRGETVGKWKGDSNPGGPGGSTRRIKTNKPQGKTSHRSQGSGCRDAAAIFAFIVVSGIAAACYGAYEILKGLI